MGFFPNSRGFTAPCSAASEALFEPDSETDKVARFIPPCLAALAQVKGTNAETLARFLDERGDSISQLAQVALAKC